jgi:tetratricopeptide (TPR) repeat protein
MDDTVIRQFHDALRQGADAFNGGNQPEALNHFERAVSLADDINDSERRRTEMREAALFLVKGRLAEMGRVLAQKAIKLDEQVDNRRHLGQDLLTLGWAEMQLGHMPEAKAIFQRALQIAEKNGDYDTAAGALTNQAIIIGSAKQYELASVNEGIRLLRKSLEYLERRKKDEFEIITRIALVQALEVSGASIDEMLPVAQILFNRFAKALRRDQWDGTIGPLRKAAQRYMKDRPGTNVDEWLQQRIPELRQQRAG